MESENEKWKVKHYGKSRTKATNTANAEETIA